MAQMTPAKLIEVSLKRGPLDGIVVRVQNDLPFWVCPMLGDGTRSSNKYLYAPVKEKGNEFVMVQASRIGPKDHDRIIWGPIQENGKVVGYGGMPA